MTLKSRIFLVILCNLFYYNIFAQQNNNWILGSYPNDPINNTGGMSVNFTTDTPVITEFDIPIGFDAIACINDEKGDLLFYTNGCEVINKNHEVMANGDGLNPGEVHNIYCDIGYYGEQSVLILPYPKHDNQYFVFSLFQEYPLALFSLKMSVVDMNANNGLGQVIEKNTISPIANSIIVYSGLTLTAVRHANGRDWYILFLQEIPSPFVGNLVYLFSDKGFERIILQPKQKTIYVSSSSFGQSCFSPNGNFYAYSNDDLIVRVWNFDRCSGILEDPPFFGYPHNDIGEQKEYFYNGGGVSFSENSRFLYFSGVEHIYQVDLHASDIAKSIVVVGEYDGFETPYPTYFSKHMLAANGKIYIDTQYPSKFMHVINNPNEKGLDCNFELRGLELPKKHYSSAPNFPYFNLYDMPDSPCDSLGIDGTTSVQSLDGEINIQIFPNPTSDVINIDWNSTYPGKWYLRDILGHNLKNGIVKNRLTTKIEMSDFPSGLYYVSFYRNEALVETRKVVLLKN